MNTLLLLDYGDSPLFTSAAAGELLQELRRRGYQIQRPSPDCPLPELLENYPTATGVMLDWNAAGSQLCAAMGQLNEKLPFFAVLPAQTDSSGRVSRHVSAPQRPLPDKRLLTVHPIAMPCRSAFKTAMRMEWAMRHYQRHLLPPFTRALVQFAEARKNTFCTTGHLLGSAYQHHAMGRAFYDFFGPNTFRADTSMSVPDMGSLLDHTGVHKDAEELIARAYGADRSYIITNGTSTANKVAGMYCISAGDTVLIDRNCHKSITHMLMMCDVIPVYLRPTRNAYGMIGGIPSREFSTQSITAKLAERDDAAWPNYAVISDSTYDGLLYDVTWIKDNLPVKQIHFDSAWSPYTPFHPIYANKYGMYGERTPGKTIFETQSAHKMLPSFAQASYVHVKGDFDEELLNETYMMHTTTSANYPIVASAEMGAAMMTGAQGRRLMQNSLDWAMCFRRKMAELYERRDVWFFRCWQPDDISELKCWPISRGETWHGFTASSDDRELNSLDPLRVSVLTPGMGSDGQLEEHGIPAAVVSRYLNCHGVVTEKTGPYHMLFLFGFGVDERRVNALVKALQDFKRDYDRDVPVRTALPDLFRLDPLFYMHMTLQQLCRGLHRLMRCHDLPRLMYHAYDDLPELDYTPYQAFQKMIRGETHEIPLADLVGHISADMILPYPPGVPLIMPGEKLCEKNSAILEFLLMLTDIGEHFPGFETEIHGAYRRKNGYFVKVLNDE